MIAMSLVGLQESWEESQGHAENPAVGEEDGEAILVEGEPGGLRLARERIHSVSFLQPDGVSAIP